MILIDWDDELYCNVLYILSMLMSMHNCSYVNNDKLSCVASIAIKFWPQAVEPVHITHLAFLIVPTIKFSWHLQKDQTCRWYVSLLSFMSTSYNLLYLYYLNGSILHGHVLLKWFNTAWSYTHLVFLKVLQSN